MNLMIRILSLGVVICVVSLAVMPVTSTAVVEPIGASTSRCNVVFSAQLDLARRTPGEEGCAKGKAGRARLDGS